MVVNVVEGYKYACLVYFEVLAVLELPVFEEICKGRNGDISILSQIELKYSKFEQVFGLGDPANLLNQCRLASVIASYDFNAPLAFLDHRF